MDRCIDCLKTFYDDDLSTVEKFVYRCSRTGEIIESVASETACEKILLQDPRHEKGGKSK